MKWQPVWLYARNIFRNLPRRFAVPRASYFQKKRCNARCDWITSCRSQTSTSNFFAGTNFCSRSETEIRSRFSWRVRSSPSGCRESQTKSISYFGCARANGIVAPSISTARKMNSRQRPGTSHSALGRMNMAARLWLACGSRACAQPRRLEAPSSNGMTSVSTNLEDLSWIPRPRLLALRRIRSSYAWTLGLSQRVLRGIIYRVLHKSSDAGWQPIAPTTLVGGERSDAIRAIHFPGSWEARDAAREHLVLSEFFAMQMLIASRRSDATIRVGGAHCGTGVLLDKFHKALPFELTGAQMKVIAEIRRDLAARHPMNRLLQGYVGSGKTVVAIAAMLLAIEAGYQAAFMAPTQILAEQHYTVLRRWLEPLGVRMALRTAARQEESFLPLVAGDENADVIVGTHALLYDTVSFSNLGLVVIDEQHKFGVAQRARLTAREPAPDVLVMTATPIPRTLTMTIYGDLDVSVIDEMPRNRGKIVTA